MERFIDRIGAGAGFLVLVFFALLALPFIAIFWPIGYVIGKVAGEDSML